MKERPILFSAPMVRALLDGSKTQTRRVVKQNAALGASLAWCALATSNNKLLRHQVRGYQQHCPYGQPGDHLWVRETHLPKASGTIYRADFSEFDAAGLGGMYGGWKPSIFCKREHSRILLEIVGVRVERLHGISEKDAKSEGCEPGLTKVKKCHGWTPYILGYAELWDSINGPGSWRSNPWVWVIEFKMVRP